jgi:hypothetical protein
MFSGRKAGRPNKMDLETLVTNFTLSFDRLAKPLCMGCSRYREYRPALKTSLSIQEDWLENRRRINAGCSGK